MLAKEISTGIRNLIKAVKIYDDEEESEGTDNMASNIINVQRQLAATERFFIGSELDKHLREIDENSRAVAHVSRQLYKTKITGLCDEVCGIMITNEQNYYYVLVSNPGHTLASKFGGAAGFGSH